MGKNSAAYSGFTFVFGFVLVFRTSQCYSRFWTCAESCCKMRAQLGEAAGSLLTFAIMTTKTDDEVKKYTHKVVRLISLLHALCLQNAADMTDENFHVIDAASFGKGRMAILAKLDSRARVDMVYQWIGALIMHSAKSGLLSTPPPILSRVFQELEKAMVEYNQVLQVMNVPFPFPYAQVSVMLLLVYIACTPVVMCYYVGNAFVAALLSFISVLCFVSIELIASELENPLGDDENDLPCHQWQDELNETLLSMLHPNANDVFELEPDAINVLELEPGANRKSIQLLDGIMFDNEVPCPELQNDEEISEESQDVYPQPSAEDPTPHVHTFPVQQSPATSPRVFPAETQRLRSEAFPPASAPLQIHQASSTLQQPQVSSTRGCIRREELLQSAAPGIIQQAISADVECTTGNLDAAPADRLDAAKRTARGLGASFV